MEHRSLKFVLDACNGDWITGMPDVAVNRVCTDSRRVGAGDLFFALRGERFDAHDYLDEVVRKGAVALVVARAEVGRIQRLCGAVGILAVPDTPAALGQLATRYRQDFQIPFVAVAGSNGKTTTKELLASLLSQKDATLFSEASFNNDVGVPLTLLNLEAHHGVAVLEVGTNHPGELPPLLRMIQPRFGVLTNIGREHLELFGDLAGVAEEQGWLAEFLPPGGKLFVDGDNEWTEAIVKRTKARAVRVGFGEANDWRATRLRVGEDGVTFQVHSPRPGFSGEYHLRLLGRHQVPNALLALAAGTELGVTPEQARRGLTECGPPKMRL